MPRAAAAARHASRQRSGLRAQQRTLLAEVYGTEAAQLADGHHEQIQKGRRVRASRWRMSRRHAAAAQRRAMR
jgi:hypothetical protein